MDAENEVLIVIKNKESDYGSTAAGVEPKPGLPIGAVKDDVVVDLLETTGSDQDRIKLSQV